MAQDAKKSKATIATRPPAPQGLPLPVIDNHTHLDYEDDTAIDDLLTTARSVSVNGYVQIGCTVQSARWTVDITSRRSDVIGGVALHPNEAPVLAEAGKLEAAWDVIAECAAAPGIRVIGETGLDYFRTAGDDPEAVAAQQESFKWHIRLAKSTGKALQIHCRDAADDVLAILDAEGAPDITVMHCFAGDDQLARTCIERGYYLSYAGNITFKNAHDLRAALLATPLERTLVETDAPYLTPEPFRGRPNSPYMIPYTVRAMAEVRNVSLRDVCAGINAAVDSVYPGWERPEAPCLGTSHLG